VPTKWLVGCGVYLVVALYTFSSNKRFCFCDFLLRFAQFFFFSNLIRPLSKHTAIVALSFLSRSFLSRSMLAILVS